MICYDKILYVLCGMLMFIIIISSTCLYAHLYVVYLNSSHHHQHHHISYPPHVLCSHMLFLVMITKIHDDDAVQVYVQTTAAYML